MQKFVRSIYKILSYSRMHVHVCVNVWFPVNY